MNPFSIKNISGVPQLLKNGTPVPPLFFWQTEIESPEARHLTEIDIELFTCFRSGPAIEHPYWVGEGKYDFSYIDEKITAFFKLCPEGYLMPRIFLFAPEWWLKAHPQECTAYPDGSEKTRPLHESPASELWKKEQGEAFRALVKFLKNAPYGERIYGIHIACHSCGEWNNYNPLAPDTSPAMEQRLGRKLERPADFDKEYFESFFSASTDAIAHFCKIVKEESDFLTAVFYGYVSCCYRPYNRHGALDRLLKIKELDMVAAPHEYSRRTAGEDGYFRAMAGSIAKHGKLFIDESDDRTPLASRKELGASRIMADTSDEAVNAMRREFGRALTNLTGMWFMDIDNGMFRGNIYWREIFRAKYWSERALKLPRKRVSQIAVIIAGKGRYSLPEEQRFMAYDEGASIALSLPALCRTGAPFDVFHEDDATLETLEKYQLVILINGLNISGSLRQTLKALRCNDRAFIWSYGSGAYQNAWSVEAMRDLTGIHFEQTPAQVMPVIDDFSFDWSAGRISPGFAPLEASAIYENWSSFYWSDPRWDAEKIRDICRRCGVFLYAETSDVLDASQSALMFHASVTGEKELFLPVPATVTDMISGAVVGKNMTRLRFFAEKGDTRLFELS